MEMEVVVPLPTAAVDFNFDSGCSTPYISAPSSPPRFAASAAAGNFFYSAPSTPPHAAAFHHQFKNQYNPSSPSDNTAVCSVSSLSKIPFNWEEKPGIPKNRSVISTGNDGDGDGDDDDGEDFAFDFSGQLERTSLPADELFDGGKIKPLKPPPRLQILNLGSADSETELNESINFKSAVSSPRSSSPIAQGKKMIKEAFSPRQRRSDFDPFEEAIKETRKEKEREQNYQTQDSQENESQRGRARISGSDTTSSNYKRKKTRSLSPFRVSDVLFGHEENSNTAKTSPSSPSASSSANTSTTSFFSSFSFTRVYRKWKLKDLLLFRSASEGRPASKDSLNKYEILSKKSEEITSKEALNKYVMSRKSGEEVKNSSFRSTDSGGGGSVSRRKGPPASPHEIHYTVNRAVAEEMRKKTFLPYKQGLLGCLGFNSPASAREISRSFGSLTRG